MLIPAANVQHLMLRQDVVQACRDGSFNVYAIRTIDEGIALLTGHAAGSHDRDGRYDVGSVNHAVEACLARFAAARRALMTRVRSRNVDVESLIPLSPGGAQFGSGSVDRDTLRAAAEFARLLQLEMLGVFIEDRALLGLGALPFARELRLPGHDWQTF